MPGELDHKDAPQERTDQEPDEGGQGCQQREARNMGERESNAGETEAVGSVMAPSQRRHNHAVSHAYLRRQTPSSRRYLGGHALVPRQSFSGVAPGRGDGDDYPVRLQRNSDVSQMCHRATTQGWFRQITTAGQAGMTCANTAWRHRLGRTTCGFKMNRLLVPSPCGTKCATWPVSGTVR